MGRQTVNKDRYLYQRLLGDAWDTLPEQVRRTYFQGQSLALSGQLRVTVGKTLRARFFQLVLRLPRKDGVAPARLEITGNRDRECWRRSIGEWKLDTVQFVRDGMLVERVGLLEFHIRLETWQRGIRYRQEAVTVGVKRLRIPLPAWASPRVIAFHLVAPPPDSLMNSVMLEAPGGALLVAYEGRVRSGE